MQQDVLIGVGVSPGLGVGPVAWMPPAVAEPDATSTLGAETADDAVARVRAAAAAVAADLEARAARLEAPRGTEAAPAGMAPAAAEAATVLRTTAMMATDPTLLAGAETLVRAGTGPARAVWQAAGTVIDQLSALGGYLGERTRDVADVRDRVVAHLTGHPAPGVPDLDHPFVLVAGDLAPADTATLDPTRVTAIVTLQGGPTSHTAILARSLGIPAVVAAPGAVALTASDVVLVDGGAGTVTRDPSPEQVERARALAGRARTFDGEGRTADGVRVPLLANVGGPEDAVAAASAGAEGIGLFRTEFCFLDRTEAPSVDEQTTAYRAVLAAFPGRKVVVRTLDAGADKPLPFLTAADEPNPALGVRGLRTSGRDPQVLDDQLAAIARAATAEQADVWVMAPMVATVEETEDFVARCAAHGLTHAGVMVEVPAAALRSGPILARAAFASIGTNDLTQYAMAADRLLGELAPLSTAWQPAVLDLVAATCRGGAQQARPVGVCGEAAADPALAVVLVGLGVTSLSMTPRALADVAAVLASVTRRECEELAALALAAETAQGARDAVRGRLPVLVELGL